MIFYCDKMRHLVCIPYSLENLHRMAEALDIKPGWFHKGRFPHYDIPKRRIEEIQAKCRLVSARDILAIIKGQFDDKS